MGRGGHRAKSQSHQFRHALANASTPERVRELAELLWQTALEGSGKSWEFAVQTILDRVAGPIATDDEQTKPDSLTLKTSVEVLIAMGVPRDKLPRDDVFVQEQPALPTTDAPRP